MWLVTWIVITCACAFGGPVPDEYGRIKPAIVSVCHEVCAETPMSRTFSTFDDAAEFVLGGQDEPDIKMLTIVSIFNKR